MLRAILLVLGLLTSTEAGALCPLPEKCPAVMKLWSLPSVPSNEITEWAIFHFEFDRIDRFDLTTDWTLTEVNGPLGAGGAAVNWIGGYSRLHLSNQSGQRNRGPVVQFDSSAAFGTLSYLPLTGREIVVMAHGSYLDTTDADTCIGLAELHATSPVVTNAGDGITSDNHICLWKPCVLADDTCLPAGSTPIDSGLWISTAGTSNANVETTEFADFRLEDGVFYGQAFHLIGADTWVAYARNEIDSEWTRLGSGTLAVGFDNPMVPTLATLDSGTANGMSIDFLLVAIKR